MSMKRIDKMDGYEFAKFMYNLRDSGGDVDTKLYNDTMERYFWNFKDSDRPIEESWEEDCDEVWDAEAYVMREIKNYIKSKSK